MDHDQRQTFKYVAQGKNKGSNKKQVNVTDHVQNELAGESSLDIYEQCGTTKAYLECLPYTKRSLDLFI